MTFHVTVIYCDMVVSVKDLLLPCLVLLLLATSVNSRGVKQFRSGRKNYKITLQAHILDIEPHKCTRMVLTKTFCLKKFKQQTKCTGPRAMIGGKR